MNRSLSGFIEVSETYEILWANPRARFVLGISDGDEHLKTGRSLLDTLDQLKAITRPQHAFGSEADWGNEDPRYVRLCLPEHEGGSWFIFRPISQENHGGRRTVWFEIRDLEGRFARVREMMNFQQAISHKLNTPIHQAIMAIRCLEQENKASVTHSEEQEAMLQIASDALNSLHSQVDKILRHTFVSQTARRSGDGLLLSEIEQTIREVSETISLKKPLDIKNSVQGSGCRYGISEEEWAMVVHELIENAVKFHPSHNPHILVEMCGRNDDYLEIEIVDDGGGVEPSKLTWMAHPYTQIEEDATGNVPGMGLGLSTLTLVLWEHGASIEIENRKAPDGLLVRMGLKRL